MTHEEHEQLLANILTNREDQGALTELLEQSRTDYTETLATVTTLTASNTDLLAKNEKLRDVNASLFLKVGNIADLPNLDKKPPAKDPEQTQENEMKFEDLIDEKGRLI